MRVLVAALAALAVAPPALGDRFRTVVIGDDTDWGSVANGGHSSQRSEGPDFSYGWSASHDGSADCDTCDHGRHSTRGGFESSSQRRSQSLRSENSLDDGAGVRRGRSNRGRTTSYHFSSKESSYTFNNGTHTTTITSKETSDGVAEFHLRMTRISDGAVIENSVLSEAEYAARRAELGLKGSAGSFGREALGGSSTDTISSRGSFDQAHRSYDSSLNSARRDSSVFGSAFDDDFFGSLDARFGGSRRGGSRGGGRGSTTTTFTSEESYYSFSNGSHTTVIRGKKNSDGVKEYHLELVRNSDKQVLDRTTISEEEYNRRRQNMSGGRGFEGVFDSSGGGSGLSTRGGFSSRRDQLPTSRPARPTPSSSRRTSYRREDEETRTEEVIGGADVPCTCTSRVQCRYSQRVYTPAALSKCESGEVCCKSAQPPAAPRTESCSCVAKDRCSSFRDRVFTPEALKRCRYPEVCCKSSGINLPPATTPRPAYTRRTRPPTTQRPVYTPRPTYRRPTRRPITQDVIDSDRELFDDIIQNFDSSTANRVSNEDVRNLQNSLSAYDDSAPIRTTEHRRSYSSRSESRTSSGGASTPDRDSGDYRRFTYRDNEADRGSGASQTLSSSESRRRESSRREYSHQSEASRDRASHSAGSGGRSGSEGHSSSSHETQQHLYEPEDLPGAVFRITTSRNTQRTVSSEDGGIGAGNVVGGSTHEQHRTYSERRGAGVHRGGVESHQPISTGGEHTTSSSRRSSYSRTSSSSSDFSDGDDHYGGSDDSFSGLNGSRRYDSTHSSQRHREGGTGGGLTHGSSQPGGGYSSSSSRQYSSRRYSQSSSDNADGFRDASGLHSGSHGLHDSNSLDAIDDSGASSSTYHSSYSSRSGSRTSSHSPPESYSSESRYSSHTRTKRGLFSSFGSAAQYLDPRANDPCVCVPFYECSDGNIVKHGADLLDVWIGPRKQCSGFKVCCDVPPAAIQHLQSSPGIKSGIMSKVSATGLSSFFSSTPPAASRPCVCVASYMCDPATGEIPASQTYMVDMRQISNTGRCNYGAQVCCAVPNTSIRPTESSATCQCTTSSNCAPQDVVSVVTSVTAAKCAVSRQICCRHPLSAVIPGAAGAHGGAYPGAPGAHGAAGAYPGAPGAHGAPGAYPGAPGAYPGAHGGSGAYPGAPGTGGVYPGAHGGGYPGIPGPAGVPGAYPGGTLPPGYQGNYDVYNFCKSYPLSVACGRANPFARLPTLRATPYFNPQVDAQRLRSAIGYWNADDEVLIEVLCRRTFDERAQIKQQYARAYGKDLSSDIERSTRGKFEDLMLELLEAPSYYEYLARKLHEGMENLGTDEDALLETLISSTNEDITHMKRYFTAIEGKTLEDDLKDDLTGDLEDIMVSLVNGSRDQSLHVDRFRARDEAQQLYRAGKGGIRVGTDEQTFKYYLTHENYAQLALIFAEYERLAGEPFLKAVEDEFSRHVEDAIIAIVQVTQNLPRYFAERLHDALWGRGPLTKDDTSLRRILISRAEIDLGTVAQEYQQKYGRTLIDDIEKKTTGDYEDGLVALLGGTS